MSKIEFQPLKLHKNLKKWYDTFCCWFHSEKRKKIGDYQKSQNTWKSSDQMVRNGKKMVNFGKTCNFVFWMLVFCAHIFTILLSELTCITIYNILYAFIFQIAFIFNCCTLHMPLMNASFMMFADDGKCSKPAEIVFESSRLIYSDFGFSILSLIKKNNTA